jgi:hypothetical protein
MFGTALAAKPATSVAAVIARIEQLVAALPLHEASRRSRCPTSQSPRSSTKSAKNCALRTRRSRAGFDVVLANDSFCVLRNALVGSRQVPKAWSPVFETPGSSA